MDTIGLTGTHISPWVSTTITTGSAAYESTISATQCFDSSEIDCLRDRINRLEHEMGISGDHIARDNEELVDFEMGMSIEDLLDIE